MWIKILQLILSLSLLVIVHELGHFLFAKMFKCRVEKFYLFFNPWFSLFKFRIGETLYGMGWIPLGGYVKISGMIDESMDSEQMKQPAQPYEFRAKPAWQRLLIMVGGVVMNVVLAAFIYIGISYAFGEAYISTNDAKYGYKFSETAQSMGFQNGDKIISTSLGEVEDANDVFKAIILDNVQYVNVVRDGEQKSIAISYDSISKALNDKKFIAPILLPIIDSVIPSGGAATAQLTANDTIIAINGNSVTDIQDVITLITENKGTVANLTIIRDTAIIEKQVSISEDGKIGIMFTPLSISTKEYTMLSSVPAGINRAGSEINSYLKQLKLIVNPETEAYKSVGGFIAIGNIFPDTWSWYSFWSLTAMLSIVLAVMNILPIPALDGGHVLFLLYEVITRRRPSDKFLERAQVVGMVLLFALLLYANGNDIFKLVSKWLS